MTSLIGFCVTNVCSQYHFDILKFYWKLSNFFVDNVQPIPNQKLATSKYSTPT